MYVCPANCHKCNHKEKLAPTVTMIQLFYTAWLMSEYHIYHERETSLQNHGTFGPVPSNTHSVHTGLQCIQVYIKDNLFENDKIASQKNKIEMENLVFNTIFSPIEIDNFCETILDTCFRSQEFQRNVCGMKAECRGKYDNFRQGLTLEDTRVVPKVMPPIC